MIEKNDASIAATPVPEIFHSTGKTLAQLDIARGGILETLKKPANLSIETGITHTSSVETTKLVENPFPVVILVSGAGGNGKDTFIDNVGKFCSAVNLSSITEIKEIAEVLVNYTKDIEDEMVVCPSKHMEQKTDHYRQFLHALKMAWADFCDGPNYRLITELRNILTEQVSEGMRYDVVFLHVREGSEIDKIKSIIENKFGIICLTMIVKGLVDSSDYVNDCDSNVDNYNYDLTIVNSPNKLVMFELQAMLFATNLKYANQIFGIESASDLYKIDTTIGTYPADAVGGISSAASDAIKDTTVGTTIATCADVPTTAAEETADASSSDNVGFHSDLNTPDAP